MIECSTVAWSGDLDWAGNFDPTRYGYYAGLSEEEREQQLKDHKKAENKAILLLQNLLGADQCDIYRKTKRVIVKPGKWFWIIGDAFDSYIEKDPFVSKPDVVRIDNPNKLHITTFCVDQRSGGPTPYTDKVIAFASHLMNNEKAFVRTINRIQEKTIGKMMECATW